MAAPRVFVSSTYYDLKHIRSSLENFIKQLGYDPILFEKGDIAFTHEQALDQSCYREASNADIFVLIIGGRYGSEKSDGKQKTRKSFETYDSVTKQEFKSAVDEDIPIYILVEKGVYAEYRTYLRNKDNDKISYAHVDSVNVFRMVEEILGMSRNNPVYQFDRYQEIEEWLKVQWAGLFRELLNRRANQNQLASLSGQINELSEINKTLKNYLEEMMRKADPHGSEELIKLESKRLEHERLLEIAKENPLVDYICETIDIPYEKLLTSIIESGSLEKMVSSLKRTYSAPDKIFSLDKLLEEYRDSAEEDFLLVKNALKTGDSNIRSRLSKKAPVKKGRARTRSVTQ